MPTRGLRSLWWLLIFFLKREMVEGRYRMIQGSDEVEDEEGVEPLMVGMVGVLEW